MGSPLYIDTSAVLRAALESGTSPEVEGKIRDAPALVTSRLAFVESARALSRLRALGASTEPQIADAARAIDAVWARCDVWEVTRDVCALAQSLAPVSILRALDALHLATFSLARRRIEGLELLTTDERLRAASALSA